MHHANLVIGNREWCLSCLPEEVRVPSIDVRHLVYERMSIADVRALIQEASLMPVEAPVRSFVIQTQQILGEAQNALLKLFEEPSAYVVFYLVLPNDDMLLPTLRSRLMVYAIEGDHDDSGVCATFLALSYAERLDLIAKMIKAEDAEWVSLLVKGLSVHAHTSQNQEILRDVLMLEKYIYTNGASKKMLLEHIALTV